MTERHRGEIGLGPEIDPFRHNSGRRAGLRLAVVSELLVRRRYANTIAVRPDGVVAQLVERLVRNEKVAGSNPVGSTILARNVSTRLTE